ncbi:MAG: DUF1446 domain-containing protein [Christensenellaceae bacterium]|nr:DUF1446 domain-containing protein [Christensenellaceae bacterium]
MSEKRTICIMAAAGMLGSTFDEEAFYHALEANPAMIGCDSGTTDSGPYYLGAGVARMNRSAAKRDLTLMITEGIARSIPVLVGSAGTAGADANVDWMVDIVREIASEQKLRFKLAVIKTEIPQDMLMSYWEDGKILPLPGAEPLTREEISKVVRCVSAVGPEPFMQALREGAQVIIAGRTTDTSIFTAVPALAGLDNAFAWHAAKVLECGSLASVFEVKHGSMLAWIREDSASIAPGNPQMQASPVSVVSHTLYENADPFNLIEPGRKIHTKDAVYTAEDDRTVRITNTTMTRIPYTVKLEGVRFEGYRRVAICGVRDPLILKQFSAWIDDTIKQTKSKIARGMGLNDTDYRLRYMVFGDPEQVGDNALGLMFDVIAATPEQANGIISNVWHTALHVPIRDWQGAQSQTAFPFSPPTLETQNGGKTFSFCLNHVLSLDDPLETARISYHEL